jgi:hypothetical protein
MNTIIARNGTRIYFKDLGAVRGNCQNQGRNHTAGRVSGSAGPPIVFVTANAMDANRERAQTRGR